MAKSAKPPSGKAKSRSKKAPDVVEAEIVDEIAEATSPAAEQEATDALPREDVPEDSDYVASDVEAAEGMSDALEDKAEEDSADDAGSDERESSDAETRDTEAPDAVDPSAEESAPAPAVAQPEPEKSGGLFGPVLGGVIAAAIGFLAAMWFFPQGWQEQSTEAIDALTADVVAQGEQLATQQGGIDAVSGEVSALEETVQGQLATLEQEVAARQEEVAALNARLDSLTKSDGTTKLPDDVQILLNTQKEELDTLRTQVGELTATAKAQMEAAMAQQTSAEEAEARVKARGALQKVRLALASGEPFAEALPDIAGAVDVPDGLQAVAESGAPTSATVQAAFPGAAREALAVALRETAGSDTQSRLQLFFKDQLGARSLTPREGDDADAVLSRAEAAVKADDFATALQEIDALPDAAKEKFDGWRTSAEARIGAVSGYEAVSDALNES